MKIGTHQRLSKTAELVVDIDGRSLENVPEQKLLGIKIDQTLSWNSQIDYVCKNVSRKITLLKQLSKYVPRSHLELYYNALYFTKL